MLRQLLVVALALAWFVASIVPRGADGASNERVQARDFFGRESIVCGATATTLSATVYAAAAHRPVAQFARITVEGAAMRWSATGVVAEADTAAELANVGALVELHGDNNLRNFRCVYATVPGAHLRVQYAR